MRFQIAVLKVLAGHPNGRASLADLKHYLTVLTSSGPEWSQRMKRLAERAPHLDIFSSGYVLRDPGVWQITEEGRQFLVSIETPLPAEPLIISAEPATCADPEISDSVVRLDEIRRQRRAAELDAPHLSDARPRASGLAQPDIKGVG